AGLAARRLGAGHPAGLGDAPAGISRRADGPRSRQDRRPAPGRRFRLHAGRDGAADRGAARHPGRSQAHPARRFRQDVARSGLPRRSEGARARGCRTDDRRRGRCHGEEDLCDAQSGRRTSRRGDEVTEGEETMRRLPAAFLVFLALAWTAPGHAQGLKQIGTIALPGKPLSDYGAVFVDQNTGKGFLTNRSNKAIDIFDTRTDKLLMRVEGFVGTRESSPVSGPQGVVTVNGGSEAWAGDGDSSIKVIEVATGKITDVLHTGGKKRIGELAYDSQDQIVLAANPNDAPPFVTLYSAKPGHRLLATIPFPSATDGIEREGYFLPTGAFYVPLPKLDHSDVTGGLAEIDPHAGKLVTIHRMENCVPHNLAEVDGALLYVACDYPGGHLAL